jgi:TPR repeat protein
MSIIDFFYWLSIGRVRTPTERYQKAAESGSAKAQFNLGLCYYLGKELEQNPSEAARWFRRSARQGNADAKFYLGRAYYSGEGVKKDLEIAYAWVEQSANQKNQKAIELRTRLEQELSPGQIAEARKISQEMAQRNRLFPKLGNG